MLTEEVVEEWLAEPTLAAWQDAAAAIRDVFGDVPVPSAAGSAAADATAPAGDWLGGLGSARSRAAFLALIRRLLSGVVGRALTLSYIADPGDVGDLRALIGVGKTGEREPLSKQLTATEAKQYETKTWLAGSDGWDATVVK